MKKCNCLPGVSEVYGPYGMFGRAASPRPPRHGQRTCPTKRQASYRDTGRVVTRKYNLARAILSLAVFALVPGCAIQQGNSNFEIGEAETSRPPDMHTSRMALDWIGTYEGVLPCASCPGIATVLTLHNDDMFELSTRYIDRELDPVCSSGSFSWHRNGNIVELDFRGTDRQFAVNEGRLVLLNLDGTRPDPIESIHLLHQTSILSEDVKSQERASLQPVLESHTWRLDAATDRWGAPIEALLPSEENYFILTFSKASLNIKGACNTFRGSYKIKAVGQGGSEELKVGHLASTMMACSPVVVKAEAALSALLKGDFPAKVSFGSGPRLTLNSSNNEVLILNGKPTLASLYGEPTTLFFEIAPKATECAGPLAKKTTCLLVRERNFDEQGLPSGTPGEWRPMIEAIEGFEHVAGYRSVVRVRRYQNTVALQAPRSYLYILDFVVQSELVP